jgi:hypothetical protein
VAASTICMFLESITLKYLARLTGYDWNVADAVVSNLPLKLSKLFVVRARLRLAFGFRELRRGNWLHVERTRVGPQPAASFVSRRASGTEQGMFSSCIFYSLDKDRNHALYRCARRD